jgi:primosomal protein N' (replication factor Y)
VRNLRLIVVDEEHEPAYKQDESPRYHGRDVAVMRAQLCGAQCLLGSATPSLESHANAVAGKYAPPQLTQRVDSRSLPSFTIVDMRIEVMRQRGATALSRPLVDAMQARFERREQTILFINRRGYSSSMQCRKCGCVEECPHCSVSMTYHRTDETLRCHLCGEQRPAPVRCTRLRGAGHPLARASAPSASRRRSGGCSPGPDRADGHGHDGQEEPLPRDPGRFPQGERSTSSSGPR